MFSKIDSFWSCSFEAGIWHQRQTKPRNEHKAMCWMHCFQLNINTGMNTFHVWTYCEIFQFYGNETTVPGYKKFVMHHRAYTWKTLVNKNILFKQKLFINRLSLILRIAFTCEPVLSVAHIYKYLDSPLKMINLFEDIMFRYIWINNKTEYSIILATTHGMHN